MHFDPDDLAFPAAVARHRSVPEEQPARHNLILARPSESLAQDHLNFGWATTIRVEATRGHRARLCGEDPADGCPLPDLGNSDKCGAPLHPFPDASAGRNHRRPRSHLAGYRSKAAKTALSPLI
jgi:hypothetical protein